MLIQIKPAGLISQTWLTIPVRNRDTKNDTDTVPQTEITRALLLSCGLHRGECGAAAHQTPFNSHGRPWRGANIRLQQTPRKKTASDPYSDVCDHSSVWQQTTPTPLPKIDNKRTGIFKSNYHISVFFSAYIIWATEKVINWKKTNRQRQVAISITALRTFAPKRFATPSAPSPNTRVVMLTVTSSEIQILRSTVLVFMSRGENSTTETYDYQRLS